MQLEWKRARLRKALCAVWEGGTLQLRRARVLSHGLLQKPLAVLGVASAESPLALPTSLQNCIRFGIPTPVFPVSTRLTSTICHTQGTLHQAPYFSQAGAAGTAELLFVTGHLVSTWKTKQAHRAARCSSSAMFPAAPLPGLHMSPLHPPPAPKVHPS